MSELRLDEPEEQKKTVETVVPPEQKIENFIREELGGNYSEYTGYDVAFNLREDGKLIARVERGRSTFYGHAYDFYEVDLTVKKVDL